MIVITNPIPIANEIDSIHALFELGLELLHLRKPYFSETEMKQFLSKINPNYRKQLVLHSHHSLASDFGVYRIHFTESIRENTYPESLYLLNEQGICLSTSTHSMESFNELRIFFEYGFLSPVFPSISKANYAHNGLFESVKNRSNFSTQLVALGGLSPENISKTLRAGFDNIALLGSIWNSNQPIENFKLCQKIAHSH